ncbi:hypothetical protein [Umezawaea tangerina]|uniref:Uncharacterized protein n=1 Tax=Umezawaea tangerina TaxID=84725 RepID=A0A2T0SXJ7_9PSEU|nr:hypothetical protein [Umezawaea tangerina]PRY38119.1 hypothetical protein CLV43_109339 [Umezawaea tangerina]
MTYVIEAVIAREELLRAATDAPLATLAAGWALLPVRGPSGDELGFWKLTAELAASAAEWSKTGPVAYVEAEFWAGVGSQRAVVWEGGEVVFGPVQLEEGDQPPAEGTAISQALRRIGVVAEEDQDAFDAVGLGRHRHTADWV